MRSLWFLGAMLVLFSFSSCKDEPFNEVIPEKPEIEITEFSINSTKFEISEDSITGSIVTADFDRSGLIAVFKANGDVTVDGVSQVSGVSVNNFTKPVIYTVSSQDGISRQYKVKLTIFTDIPILYITTEGGAPIVSKEDYVKAVFRFDANSYEAAESFIADGKIKGRGNSTWSFIKKPYKIKFSTEQGFFSQAPAREWVLLANYADKSLLRNYLSMTLSKQMEMAFSPCIYFVEVFINGESAGNFTLSDQVEVGPSRVDIEILENTETDPNMITGGYLLEIDQRVLETQDEPFFESQKFPIVVKYPDEVSGLQMNYIKNYISEAETALFGSQFKDPVVGFRRYFDEESIIRWFIVSEIYKNVDSKSFSSIYFYKKRNHGKLYFGPLWDFDLGAGNANHNQDCMEPTGWYTRFNPWIMRMFEDPAFKAKTKEIWQQYKIEIYNQVTLLEATLPYINKSKTNNFALWGDFSDPSWCVAPNLPSFSLHVYHLKTFLKERIDWIDANL